MGTFESPRDLLSGRISRRYRSLYDLPTIGEWSLAGRMSDEMLVDGTKNVRRLIHNEKLDHFIIGERIIIIFVTIDRDI